MGKIQGRGGNYKVADIFFMNDFVLGYAVYTIAYIEPTTSVNRWFIVYYQGSDTWYRAVKTSSSGTTLYSDTKTFESFTYGQPRVSAWTTSTSNNLGQSPQSAIFSSINAKDKNSSTWTSWVTDWQSMLCHRDSPYWVHMYSHTDKKIVHMGPYTPSGEVNDCVYGPPNNFSDTSEIH